MSCDINTESNLKARSGMLLGIKSLKRGVRDVRIAETHYHYRFTILVIKQGINLGNMIFVMLLCCAGIAMQRYMA